MRDAVALLDQLATYGSGKIADDEAANGWLSLSQGQWHIFG